MKHSESLQNIFGAMANIQSEIHDADKDISGYGYKYANLSQVLSIIRPLSSKYGIAFSQHVTVENSNVGVETIVGHKSGEWMSSELSMPVVQGKGMNVAQSVGMATTYARRYALTAIYGITQQDEDSAGDDLKKSSSIIQPNIKIVGETVECILELYSQDDKLDAYGVLAVISQENKAPVFNALNEAQRKWVTDLMRNPPKIQ